jgi:hypothetical protein
MLALLAGGTPVAYALGAASVLTFAASGNTQYLAIVPQRIFSQIDVFALMAMPLFILAGEIILYFCVVGPGQDLARGFLARSASRSTEVIGLSMAWFTVSLPVAFIAILIHVAAELLARRKS